jgi:uncharacterized repeat protein (TIGR03806 family)
VAAVADDPRPYGLGARPPAPPYLLMPDNADGPIPALLSQTGAFADVAKLTPASALIPYDLIVPFWSDRASKLRWVSVPDGSTVKFAPEGEWTFPNGTVFVKQFELATDETKPEIKRRLETRLLVRDRFGGVYGVTYKWRLDNSDADLLDSNLTEDITIKTASGTRVQHWYYPSRADCQTCHTANAGLVLGVKTRQMNRDFVYPGGVVDNEIRAWNHAGLFSSKIDETGISKFPCLARADDLSRSLEERARSYLDANCAHCHRPHGTVATFDARYDTPLERQNLIGAPVLIDQRIDSPRVVAPNDIWRSLLYVRASTLEPMKMPPLAHNELDEKSISLLRDWIQSLPGQPTLPPPAISPRGGRFDQPVTVAIKSEPGATIYYTLDGTVPGTSDSLYNRPISLTGPAIVRAKAFKSGFTRSVTVQEVFVINAN